jgi:hypothetical protein
MWIIGTLAFGRAHDGTPPNGSADRAAALPRAAVFTPNGSCARSASMEVSGNGGMTL